MASSKILDEQSGLGLSNTFYHLDLISRSLKPDLIHKVSDKEGSLYASVAHVLKPGAPFVLFDILSTGAEEPQYPAPWAATPEQSFRATADEISAHLERVGFSVIEIKDQTSEALAFLDESIARTKTLDGPPPLGLHLVLGPTFKEIIAVARRNLVEGRLAPTVIYTRKN